MSDPEAAVATLAFTSIALVVFVTRVRIPIRSRLALGAPVLVVLALSPARAYLTDVVVIALVAWSAAVLAPARCRSLFPRAIVFRRVGEGWRRCRDRSRTRGDDR